MKIKLSKTNWEEMGKKAGWMTKEAANCSQALWDAVTNAIYQIYPEAKNMPEGGDRRMAIYQLREALTNIEPLLKKAKQDKFNADMNQHFKR